MIEEDWEVQADAEDNIAANISITHEEYDADSETDSEPEIKLGFDDY